ncbi:MAG: sodium:proton antiporter NhaD [Candidatus Limisoma sp.]|nr:sodium:proton antiporter NhaD [Bacteroidales bacterium]MDD7760000.1 sodium:proton antiporter NhaD [Bacteroidales bacterium]MDY5893025.1 sodium:proton antiporter NhaD [Candidatus Limisoma sp.]
MMFLSFSIVVVFLLGYTCIALENGLKVNKTAIALLMCTVCWTLYMFGCPEYVSEFHAEEFSKFMEVFHLDDRVAAARQFIGQKVLLEHLGDTCEILFFLMGAMTIVEVVDSHGGLNFVRSKLATRGKRLLLWRFVAITFFLSAVLDNLTTTILMVMVLRKLVPEKSDRMIFAAMIILAANAGGAFSPIGDVTTIMLWIKGNITSIGVVKEVLLPSLVSILVPTFILQYKLKGNLEKEPSKKELNKMILTKEERVAVFVVGVGGLMFVPFFRSFTGLPPFMGILLVLGVLWTMTEVFLRHEHEAEGTLGQRVSKTLHKIDMSTILFFLGILMTVASLSEIGVLSQFGMWLERTTNGNAYLVTGIIGMASSVVDNVPLVAGCIGMYEVASPVTTDPMAMMFVQDGLFWQLLAYCAGVGGSLLIVGSAAGVVVMGSEKMTFGWYARHISLIAFIGYLAGMATYWLERTFLF